MIFEKRNTEGWFHFHPSSLALDNFLTIEYEGKAQAVHHKDQVLRVRTTLIWLN